MRWSKTKLKDSIKKHGGVRRMFKPNEVTLWFELMDNNDNPSGCHYQQLQMLRYDILRVDFEVPSLLHNREWYRKEFLTHFTPLKASEMIEFYKLNGEIKNDN